MPRAARVEAEIGARAAAARMPPFAYYYSKQGAQAPRVEQPRPPRRRRGRPLTKQKPPINATHHNLRSPVPPRPARAAQHVPPVRVQPPRVLVALRAVQDRMAQPTTESTPLAALLGFI